MGSFFLMIALPFLIALFIAAVIMAIAGIAISIVGVSGSIVAATALNNSKIKAASILFFISLILIGLCCVAVVAGFFTGVYPFMAPTITIVGILVVVLGIIGILKALAVEHKPAKITYSILLTLSTIIGALLLAIGIIALFTL